MFDVKRMESTQTVDNTVSEAGSSHWNRVLDKINQIAYSIQETDEWQRFKEAEYKIEHHGDAQALLFVVKAMRNKYSQVSLRLGYEHPDSIAAKAKYNEVLAKMANIPLIDQYQAYQEELNELMQGVTATVLASLSERIPVERGEAEETGGCSSGGCGGGCGGCH